MTQPNRNIRHIKTTLKDFLNESISADKENIISFVADNSYFEYEGDEDGDLHFATRKNGSVVDETPSNVDIFEAKNLIFKLEQKFKDIIANFEVVDEWVLITIKDVKQHEDVYLYTFIKDYEGKGFKQGFYNIDDLIKEAKKFIDTDWDDVRKKFDAINTFPKDTFTGWHKSDWVLIKSADEEGNTSGYNFYIMKSKKDTIN